jgi:hypothetical protein
MKPKKAEKSTKPSFTKISERLDAGAMESGYSLIECVAKETQKAIAFHVERWNRAANLYSTIVWFPKSQAIVVENDFYEKGDEKLHLFPNWLFAAKRADGYEI